MARAGIQNSKLKTQDSKRRVMLGRSASRLPLLGLTMGDPAGIGPEVIAKALAGKAVTRLCRPVVIGTRAVMEETVRRLRLSMKVIRIDDLQNLSSNTDQILVFEPPNQPLELAPVKEDAAAFRALIDGHAVALVRPHLASALGTRKQNRSTPFGVRLVEGWLLRRVQRGGRLRRRSARRPRGPSRRSRS